MNRIEATRVELTSALERGVRQLVFIGPRQTSADLVGAFHRSLQVFAVDEGDPTAAHAGFVPTRFESEELATALARSQFDKLKATLFIWVGHASYRTMEAALSTLSFIASLPKGSGVVLDYAAERRAPEPAGDTALDALASRIACATGAAKYLIQPQAVAAMFRGLGFGHMTDETDNELSSFNRHIVSAVV
jgi:O-methyltransferase involved in polyketide biosynthesis